jgi:hypothetical protein
MSKKKGLYGPRGWQLHRKSRSKQHRTFNLTPVPVPNDDETTHVYARPTPKRPWHCPHCPARLAYSHTLDKHLLAKHAALLPEAHRDIAKGPIRCRWCPAGYQSQAEVTLHEQAFHARNLALDIGGYSTSGA